MTSRSIIIVDDELIFAEDLKQTLLALGYTVPAIFISGEQVLAKLEELRPDLILMDIVLAGQLDGVATAERIHTQYNIPVIFLTAYADKHLMERARVTEPFGYILKPYDERELQTAIEIALYKHEMEKKLKEAYDLMEARVKERTEDLLRINETLQFEILERKHMEEALMKVSEKLSLLNTLTRHDVRNYLTVLLGYLELSETKTSDLSLLDLINKEKRAADAILRALEFSKESRAIGVHAPEWRKLNDAVLQAAHSLDLSGKKLQVDCDKVEVHGDPLFERVFYNLMDNSLKHAVNVTTIRCYYQENDSGLTIIYEDDGPGIPREDKKRLFEYGFGKHTGLGLFLIREILKITGFAIRETGEPGKGARFEITVPKGAYRFSS
jgi:signal transduction histidine kinase